MKNKSPSTTKTSKEILEQSYITALDLQILIPDLGYHTALAYIKDMRREMKEKGYFVPGGRKYVALTKLVKKKYGL